MHSLSIFHASHTLRRGGDTVTRRGACPPRASGEGRYGTGGPAPVWWQSRNPLSSAGSWKGPLGPGGWLSPEDPMPGGGGWRAGGPNQGTLGQRHRRTCCCWVTKLCLTLCNPMDCSMPGFPVQSLLKLTCIGSVMRPAVSSSVAPFSACPQYFLESGSFPAFLLRSDGPWLGDMWLCHVFSLHRSSPVLCCVDSELCLSPEAGGMGWEPCLSFSWRPEDPRHPSWVCFWVNSVCACEGCVTPSGLTPRPLGVVGRGEETLRTGVERSIKAFIWEWPWKGEVKIRAKLRVSPCPPRPRKAPATLSLLSPPFAAYQPCGLLVLLLDSRQAPPLARCSLCLAHLTGYPPKSLHPCPSPRGPPCLLWENPPALALLQCSPRHCYPWWLFCLLISMSHSSRLWSSWGRGVCAVPCWIPTAHWAINRGGGRIFKVSDCV